MEDLSLTAEIGGLPFPEVCWYHNDTVLKSELIKQKGNSQTLKCSAMNEKQAGVYSVVAKNDVDQTKVSCEVVVEYPPSFVKELQMQECIEGLPVDLAVEADGLPKPELQWLKDGKKVLKSNNLDFISDCQLHINKFNSDDIGKYEVKATNSIGAASTETSLQILGMFTFRNSLTI